MQKVWTPLDVSDFEPYIKQIRNDVDAVFVCTTINPAQKFLPQFRKLKGKLPLIGSGVNFDESVLKATGDAGIGGVSTQSWSPSISSPANERFLKEYRAKFNTMASWSAECGYTSGLLIEQAVKSINGDVENKDKLLTALKRVELPATPRGPVKLDEYANPIESVYIRKVEMKNGSPENIVIHTYPNVSQFWKYNAEEYLKQPEYRRAYPPCKHCIETDTK